MPIPAIAIAKAFAYASSLALMAAGITIIYMSTRTFNFAHASLVAWGFYVVYTLHTFLGGSPYYYLPAAFLFSGFLGVVIYLLVTGPLMRKGATPITLMMSTLGCDLVLLSLLQMYADYLTNVFKLYARRIILEVYDINILGLPGITIISLVVVIALITSLHIFLVKTKFGIAMRATIENPSLASTIGINPSIVYLASWFIGGGLAGLGGGLASLVISGDPTVGMRIIVAMFAASIVGGLYSVYGSILGGFLIGLTEFLGILALSNVLGGWVLPYRPVIPLVAMAITLLIYPRGLAGINWQALIKRFKGGIEVGGGGK